jgi:hypothetical protein
MTAAQQEALAKTEPTQLVVVESWQSTEALKARINQIQRLMNDVLQKDVDYGVIPNMPKGTKPCLLKPGSEQILAMFRIAVDPIVEDLSTEDCFRYRVTVRLTDSRTEAFLGAGLGEASTDETKYKWKRTYSAKEYEATSPDRRKSKWTQFKDDHGQWQDKEDLMIRQEPADLANTVLKMAKKRAQIDATLTVTGASSMFEQDTLSEDDVQREERAPQGKRKGKTAQKPGEDVKCADCDAINGHLPSCKYHPSAKKETKPAAAETKSAKPETVEGEVVVNKMVVQVKGTTDATTAPAVGADGKPKGGGAPYVKYDVISDATPLMYCFHRNMNDELKAKGLGNICLLRFSMGGKDKNRFVIEEILEIAGVKYQDGKPVGAPTKAEEPW